MSEDETTMSSAMPVPRDAPLDTDGSLVLRENRFDHVQLKKSNFKTTPQGFIRVKAQLSRVGVFPYVMPDGKVRHEFRPPEEVLKSDSIASLSLAPVTDLHPRDGMVNPVNAKDHLMGVVSENLKHDGKLVYGDLVIHNAKLIEAIDNGERKDLSPGYTCRIEKTPGTYKGVKYDCVQRDINYNHMAILPVGAGRQGSEVSIRLDGASFQLTHGEMKKMEDTETVKLDGFDLEVAKGGSQIVNKAITDRDEKLDQAKKDHDALQAKYDQAVTDIDLMKETLKKAQDPATVRAIYAARLDVEGKASKLVPELKLDGLNSELEIKRAVVVAKFPEHKDRSDDYISARFDAMVETIPSTSPDMAKTLNAVERVANTRLDSQGSESQKTFDAAYEARKARDQAAWMQPIEGAIKRPN